MGDWTQALSAGNLGVNAIKAFQEIMSNFLTPKGLDAVILEGHQKLIERVVSGESVSENTIAFLSGYKKMVREQKNCVNVVEKAKAYLKESSKPEEIQEDWLAFFFDKVRLITDETVQDIWGRILAEEANRPGYIRPSLLHALSIMSKDQASFFSNISRFCMRQYKTDNIHIFIFLASRNKSYEKSNITHEKLRELERLGLIDCEFSREYVFHGERKFICGNHIIDVYGDSNNDMKIKAGNVVLTEDGKTLYTIVSEAIVAYRQDILDFTLECLKARNCRVIVNGKEI